MATYSSSILQLPLLAVSTTTFISSGFISSFLLISIDALMIEVNPVEPHVSPVTFHGAFATTRGVDKQRRVLNQRRLYLKIHACIPG
jgi:hypothetical protein